MHERGCTGRSAHAGTGVWRPTVGPAESLPAFISSGLRAPMRSLRATRCGDATQIRAPEVPAHCDLHWSDTPRIASSRCDYLLGQFAMRIRMAVVRNHRALGPNQPPLGPATRRCWSDRSLRSNSGIFWIARPPRRCGRHQLFAAARHGLGRHSRSFADLALVEHVDVADSDPWR